MSRTSKSIAGLFALAAIAGCARQQYEEPVIVAPTPIYSEPVSGKF